MHVRPTLAGQPLNNTPLNCTEQTTINTQCTHKKHYLLLTRNIERVCFTALATSINEAFKVSKVPTIQGWHAGTPVIDILDQVSRIYGQPTPDMLKMNDAMFCSPYLTTKAPKVLFCCIKECAEMALLGCNPYTGRQLITNAIRLLLTTSLYIQLFKEWDCLAPQVQT